MRTPDTHHFTSSSPINTFQLSVYHIHIVSLLGLPRQHESQYLQVNQQTNPSGVNDVVIAESSQEWYIELYGDVEATFPFESPEPRPVVRCG